MGLYYQKEGEKSMTGWKQVLNPSGPGEGVQAGPLLQTMLAELALLLVTLTSSHRPEMRDLPWPLQCFTVLIAGRISLINFHYQYLISVVVVPSTVNTKNSLFRSTAMADEVSEDLLSALD